MISIVGDGVVVSSAWQKTTHSNWKALEWSRDLSLINLIMHVIDANFWSAVIELRIWVLIWKNSTFIDFAGEKHYHEHHSKSSAIKHRPTLILNVNILESHCNLTISFRNRGNANFQRRRIDESFHIKFLLLNFYRLIAMEAPRVAFCWLPIFLASLWFNMKSFLILSRWRSAVGYRAESFDVAGRIQLHLQCNIIRKNINKKSCASAMKTWKLLCFSLDEIQFDMQSTTKFFNCNCFW